jgi:hypothetical protein
MDQAVLVRSGHLLIRELDKAGLAPRAAMWVHNTETDTWKLWVVPPAALTDKREFYRRIAELVTHHRSELGGIEASDAEMILDEHPGMQGLKRFIKAEGLSAITFAGNKFNDYYLPEGIILRMAL